MPAKINSLEFCSKSSTKMHVIHIEELKKGGLIYFAVNYEKLHTVFLKE